MKPEVILEMIYPCSPERVWRALTDRRVLAEWLLPNDFEPQLGHQFHFVGHGHGGGKEVIECEVVDFQPPFRLAYTWRAPSERASSLVTWTLTPVPGGTRLRLSHTRADAAAVAHGRDAAAADVRAWTRRLAELGTILGVRDSSRYGGGTWRTTGSFDGARVW